MTWPSFCHMYHMCCCYLFLVAKHNPPALKAKIQVHSILPVQVINNIHSGAWKLGKQKHRRTTSFSSPITAQRAGAECFKWCHHWPVERHSGCSICIVLGHHSVVFRSNPGITSDRGWCKLECFPSCVKCSNTIQLCLILAGVKVDLPAVRQ